MPNITEILQSAPAISSLGNTDKPKIRAAFSTMLSTTHAELIRLLLNVLSVFLKIHNSIYEIPVITYVTDIILR